MPRVPRALIALTALAAALRLPTLGSQSLWLDEVLTGELARGSLGGLFHRVAEQEANPPLFYVVEWLWTRVAGTSEIALRLPSALCGIALVPVAYGIGRRLASERAGVALAALVAVHPLLVYYSQEARGYAAVALACAVGFLYFLDAVEGRRGALGWAVASAVALGCHYFAIFPIAIEAAILLARRGRAALPALAGVGVVGLGLLPLVLEQIGGGHSENVTAGVGLAERAKGAATSWLVGERGAAIDGLEWLVGALLVAGVVVLVVRRDAAQRAPPRRGRRRRRGADAAARARRRGLPQQPQHDRGARDRARDPGARVCARPARGGARGRGVRGAAGRHDRGTDRSRARARGLARRHARAPGHAGGRRGAAVQRDAVRWYAPGLRPVPAANVRELAVVIPDPKRDPLAPGALDQPPAPGFTPAGTQTRGRLLIARYRAADPRPSRSSGRRVGRAPAWARRGAAPGGVLLARP